MDTIFINSENSKTPDSHRILLNLLDYINLKGSDKYVALSNVRISHTWKNMRRLYKHNIFKISVPKWNEEFELPVRTYSLPDILDDFKCIFKKMR